MNLYLAHSDEEKRRYLNTPKGMAFWSGSGPADARCHQCQQYGDIGDGKKKLTRRCRKYFHAMGEVGGPIPADTAACKYFDPAPKADN